MGRQVGEEDILDCYVTIVCVCGNLIVVCILFSSYSLFLCPIVLCIIVLSYSCELSQLPMWRVSVAYEHEHGIIMWLVCMPYSMSILRYPVPYSIGEGNQTGMVMIFLPSEWTGRTMDDVDDDETSEYYYSLCYQCLPLTVMTGL